MMRTNLLFGKRLKYLMNDLPEVVFEGFNWGFYYPSYFITASIYDESRYQLYFKIFNVYFFCIFLPVHGNDF